MKLIRVVTADQPEPRNAVLQPDGSARLFADSGGALLAAGSYDLRVPVPPTQILGIGLNYRAHAAEGGKPLPEYPLVFMKALGAVQRPSGPILLPRHLRSDQVDYEGELAVVIGKAGKNIAPENAYDHVLGYTCANDVSARDWQFQKGAGQFCRGKSFDTFCPLGPCLVTHEEISDPHALTLVTRLNGEVVQESSTADLIFSIPTLIAFLSGGSTLLPGTVILTGTPAGVGYARKPPRWLQPGDRLSVEISKIGILENSVEEEKE